MSEGVSLDPRDGDWEKSLECGLPDCRVKPLERDGSRFHLGRLVFDKVFCASCGADGGGVTPSSPHVFFLCDKCAYEKGAPPECIQVNEPLQADPVQAIIDGIMRGSPNG